MKFLYVNCTLLHMASQRINKINNIEAIHNLIFCLHQGWGSCFSCGCTGLFQLWMYQPVSATSVPPASAVGTGLFQPQMSIPPVSATSVPLASAVGTGLFPPQMSIPPVSAARSVVPVSATSVPPVSAVGTGLFQPQMSIPPVSAASVLAFFSRRYRPVSAVGRHAGVVHRGVSRQRQEWCDHVGAVGPRDPARDRHQQRGAPP